MVGLGSVGLVGGAEVAAGDFTPVLACGDGLVAAGCFVGEQAPDL